MGGGEGKVGKELKFIETVCIFITVVILFDGNDDNNDDDRDNEAKFVGR